MEWEGNKDREEKLAVYFDTDKPASSPPIDHLALVKARYGTQKNAVIDYNIENLANEIDALKDILPGECYRRFERIMSDRERIDRKLKTLVADYFIKNPKYVEPGIPKQELADTSDITFINLTRDGSTEYAFGYPSYIYVDELYLLVKPDGRIEIHYRNPEDYGSGNECCEVLAEQ